MTLNLEQKKAIVAEVNSVAANAISAVAADYRGLTVSEMNELRSKARTNGIYARIIRNTLAKRALDGTSFACMNDVLSGPLVLMFSKEEPSAAPRLVRDFIQDHEKLQVVALSLSGALFSGNDLERIASLPSRDEAISMLMSVMLAPVTKFVRTMAEPHAKLVRTIAAIRDKKQAA